MADDLGLHGKVEGAFQPAGEPTAKPSMLDKWTAYALYGPYAKQLSYLMPAMTVARPHFGHEAEARRIKESLTTETPSPPQGQGASPFGGAMQAFQSLPLPLPGGAFQAAQGLGDVLKKYRDR